jgi:hypothetical protein
MKINHWVQKFKKGIFKKHLFLLKTQSKISFYSQKQILLLLLKEKIYKIFK